ncbi:hypothetical protein Syun_028971 [Stephania yunnanensis]|uniref:ubiquitinyl hydrolase 1 n=1 Tax=Stephania yunnanensis TaxID=152371 RepID=A0AAP0HJ14_9MAGN
MEFLGNALLSDFLGAAPPPPLLRLLVLHLANAQMRLQTPPDPIDSLNPSILRFSIARLGFAFSLFGRLASDGRSINGGMLYYEVHELKLCAVHCVNTVLQGPFFSEFDFAALASDLNQTERQMMIQSSGDFARFGGAADESHNVSMGGDFSIQVVVVDF